MNFPSVLMVCRNAQGGMKEHLSTLTEGLVQANFRVSLAGSLRSMSFPSRLFPYGGELYNIPLPESLFAMFDYPLLSSLVRLLRERRFDIVHTHGYMAGLYGRLAALKAGQPIIVHTVHNFFPGFSPLAIYCGKTAEVWLSKKTQRIIAVSAQLKTELIQMGISSEKLITIHNGINTNKFSRTGRKEARHMLNLDPDTFVVGSVARLIQAKGMDLFLQALALLRLSHPQIKGIVVGDGPQAGQLRQLAGKLGLAENIAFLGQRRDVPQLLPAFDIFVLPSRSEGLGISILEAQAAGLPVIASRTGGITEIISHGQNGLLFSVENYRELAGHIQFLISNVEYRKTLAENGLKKVRTEFTADKMVNSTAQLYRQVLEGAK